MELTDSVMEFLDDTEGVQYLKSDCGGAYISYLTDIFESVDAGGS